MYRLPLAASLVLASTLPAAAQEVPAALSSQGTVLDVTAEGRVTRTPDLATIRAGVVSQAQTAQAALADNAQRMSRVVAALKAAGIAERDLSTASVSLQPHYRRSDDDAPPVITGYQANNSIAIRFREVARAGAVLDTLVKQGANQISGPDLSLSDPDAALDAARTDAVAKARARADLYARAAGLHVGRIVSIDEQGSNAGGSPNPPILFRAMAASAPSTPVLAGETDVTATVAVRFLLN